MLPSQEDFGSVRFASLPDQDGSGSNGPDGPDGPSGPGGPGGPDGPGSPLR